jgi:hypothetical protein
MKTNETEDPEKNLCHYSYLVFDKSPKHVLEKKTVSLTNVDGNTVYPHALKLKLDPCLLTCTNINSNWSKIYESLKLLHGKHWNTQA